jgi:hypothetical protein
MAKPNVISTRVSASALYAYPQFTTIKRATWLDNRPVDDPTFQLFTALDDNGRAGRAVIMEFSTDALIQLREQIDACLAECGTHMLDTAVADVDEDDE